LISSLALNTPTYFFVCCYMLEVFWVSSWNGSVPLRFRIFWNTKCWNVYEAEDLGISTGVFWVSSWDGSRFGIFRIQHMVFKSPVYTLLEMFMKLKNLEFQREYLEFLLEMDWDLGFFWNTWC
jgi:hypothetical protein